MLFLASKALREGANLVKVKEALDLLSKSSNSAIAKRAIELIEKMETNNG